MVNIPFLEKESEEMIIKYCPVCKGKPYTTTLSMRNCPICNASLSSETVQTRGKIPGRSQLPAAAPSSSSSSSGANPTATQTRPGTAGSAGNPSASPYTPPATAATGNPANRNTPAAASTDVSGRRQTPATTGRGSVSERRSGGGNGVGLPPLVIGRKEIVSGKVCKYSRSSKEEDKYRRLIFERLWHLFVYGQRCDDVLHRFSVASDEKDGRGYTRSKEVPVNVYGIIAGGATLQENDEVEVIGKYNRNNVLRANRVYIKNSGRPVQLKLQHSVKAITYTVLLILAVAALIYSIINYDGAFLDGVKKFFITWGVFSVIYLILFGIATLSVGFMGFLVRALRGKGFPIAAILILSFITALVYLDVGGLGGIFMRGFGHGMGVVGGFIAVIIVLVIVVRLLV